MEPVWLIADDFLFVVDAECPGLVLVRRDILLSALDAAPMAFAYGGEQDVLVLAGIYAQRVAKAHAFVDGNKRTALIAATTFLEINGVSLSADPEKAASVIGRLASGSAKPVDFAQLFRSRED